MKGCKTCELIERRDGGGVPLWGLYPAHPHFGTVHSYNTALAWMAGAGGAAAQSRRWTSWPDDEAIELGMLVRRVSLALRQVTGCIKTLRDPVRRASRPPPRALSHRAAHGGSAGRSPAASGIRVPGPAAENGARSKDERDRRPRFRHSAVYGLGLRPRRSFQKRDHPRLGSGRGADGKKPGFSRLAEPLIGSHVQHDQAGDHLG